MTGQVRASPTNFGRTQSSYSMSQSCEQNSKIGVVENHHHRNHSNSPASEPIIGYTNDEFKVEILNSNNVEISVEKSNRYNNDGDLVKECRDVLIERLSYLMLRCGLARLLLSVQDVAIWVEKDCRLKIT